MSQVYDTVNISTIKLAPPRASKASASCKTAYIQDASGSRISIQTPVMRLPWDTTPKQMDEGSAVNASLSMSFAGDDEDVVGFKKFLFDFDQKVKELAKDMSGVLGKKADAKVIDANFKDSVKESSSGDWPSTFQAKVWLKLVDGGNPKCVDDFTMDLVVYNMNGEKIGNDQLKKGCPAAAVIQPSYVWCSTMGVGITWVAKQCIVKPAALQQECAFNLNSGGFDKYRDEAPEPSAKRAKVETRDEVESESDDESVNSSLGGDPLENEEF